MKNVELLLRVRLVKQNFTLPLEVDARSGDTRTEIVTQVSHPYKTERSTSGGKQAMAPPRRRRGRLRAHSLNTVFSLEEYEN